MILFLILIGFLGGGIAASVALAGGGGVFAAVLAYAVFGFVAVVFSALITAFVPRPRAGRAPVRVAPHRPPTPQAINMR